MRIFCTGILFVTVCLGLHAQEARLRQLREVLDTTQQDSLRSAAYYELAYLTRNLDLARARSMADSGLFYAKEYGEEAGIHLKTYLDAILAQAGGDLDKAVQLSHAYYQWTLSSGNTHRRTYAVSGLAKYYRESGNLTQAIHYTLLGIALQDSIGQSQENGFYYAELGDMYAEMQQWEEALRYGQKSYALARETGFEIGQSTSLRSIASSFIELGYPDSARAAIVRAIAVDSTLQYPVGIARGYVALGEVEEKDGNPSAAAQAYRNGLRALRSTDNRLDRAHLYQGLARISLANKELDTAVSYLDSAGHVGRNEDAMRYRADHLQLTSSILAEKGDYAGAFQALKDYTNLRDTLLNANIANTITGLNIKYETTQKEQAIVLLNQEKEISALRLASSQRRLAYFAVGISLLTILSFVLFRLYRKIQTKNAMISRALEEKNILLREIHHRVKNNLQVISSLLNLQSRYVVDPGALHALKEGKDRVRSMALIHQNLYQEGNLTGIDMQEYFHKLAQSLFDSYNIASGRISLALHIDKIHLDVDTVIPLGLVVNELITNALKHAFPDERDGSITISMREKNGLLELIVADNGIGMSIPDDQGSGSFGFRLIRIFQQKLEADLEVRQENGTAVVLSVRDFRKAG